MEDFATGILIFLGIIVFLNYRNGTLSSWLKAKFFNASSPSQSNVFKAAS